MGIIFFIIAYLVFALPFILLLWLLKILLTKTSKNRIEKIVIFSIAAILLLSPFATQMASLFVGAAPIGYFLIEGVFNPKAMDFSKKVFLDFFNFHIIGIIITTLISIYVSVKMFYNNTLKNDAQKARAV